MNYGILLAGGKSQRFEGNKLTAKIKSKAVWEWSLELLTSHKLIDEVLVVSSDDLSIKGVKRVDSGETRFDSLKSALNTLQKKLKRDDVIVVHNAANPLATKKEISKVIRAAKKNGAAAVAGPVIDTIKKVSKDHKILETVDRTNMRSMQTPQALRADVLNDGLSKITTDVITDEMMIAEKAGARAYTIPKSSQNIKITTRDDLIFARIKLGDIPLGYACGIGDDSHKFDEKEMGLIIGGICIEDEPKLKANSDGDVILHAIINAILSALGEGSLSHFADDMCQKGITDSREYLDVALDKMNRKGYRINNMSVSLECARPKFEPISKEIKKSLSDLIGIPEQSIGLTATSGEKLTSFGKGEGIRCNAIVSLVQ